MKSVMQHQFSRVPSTDIQRSSFDRSHGLKTTFDAGYLVPCFVDEVLPGDTFNLKMDAFLRMATPIYPIMDNIKVETFFFFVPNRIIWDNFKRFMGEQTDPNDSTDYLIPSRTQQFLEGTLPDYFGLPVGTGNITANDLPFRAYNKIYNDWFRDQNLQDSAYENKEDGVGLLTNYPLRKRGKRHDYFTSCLPWPQKGDSVDIPIGTTAPVVTGAGNGQVITVNNESDEIRRIQTDGGTAGNLSKLGVVDNSTAGLQGQLYADLSEATASTINQLRQAFQIQKLLEKDARGGTRYVELIASHFNIYNAGGDARLQRAEYLGGGSSNVNIHPIAQTSETGDTPQGNLSAIGTAAVNNHGFTKSFTEHGFVIGLINVRADLTYQQGINRMWSRKSRYDLYWPSLAHIGEQAVLNKEIFADGNVNNDEGVFGYQERYAEYRYKPSMITGKFRSNGVSGSLDAWHLSQDFATLPALNDDFIQDSPPMDRVLAVPSEPDFIADIYFNLRCARPMPMYGVPGMIDHF